MTTDIDPAFADRCALAATNLRQLSELGARPDADEHAMMGAAALTAELLADPEALLAVALTAAQMIESVRKRLVDVLRQDPIRRVPDDEPLSGAADLVAGDLLQARSRLEDNREPPPRPDDLSTLRRGETRLVGGKMWARCKSCGFVGPMEGAGTWHVCDPVTEPGLLARQR